MGKALGSYFKKTDLFFLLICAGSSIFATILLISIEFSSGGGFELNAAGEIIGLGGYQRAAMQAAASAAGVVIAIIISTFDYRNLVKLWPIHVALTWGLVLPTLVANNVVLGPLTIGFSNGTENTSWYKLAGVTFQPTELAKISFILTFAMHLNNVRQHINEPKQLLRLIAHMVVPALIIMIQGDDGTAMIFLIIGACMLFMGGISWKYIAVAAAGLLAVVGIVVGFFRDSLSSSYQWLRIQALLDPQNLTGWAANETVYSQYTYQQAAGEIAMGAGQIFGMGLFSGEYYYVPYVWNDFIFSWLGFATGFVGCSAVLIVLFCMVFRVLFTGVRSEDLLGTYICTGIAGAVLAQIFINVGMNLRVLPVIGITLPFYSAGGSSVTMLYISVGIVLSVYIHNKKSLFDKT